MITILLRICSFFLDIFFPIKSTSGAYATNHTKHANCHNLNVRHEMSLSRSHGDVFYTLKYKQDSVKRMIWRFKYYLDKSALRMCTYILYDQLLADVSDRVGRLPFQAPSILIHYPSSTYFRGDKNFDHMKELMLLLDSFQNQDEPFFTCCIHAVLLRQRQSITHEFMSGTSENEYTPQHLGTRRQRFEWSKKRFVLSPNFEKYMQERAHKSLPVRRTPQTAHISPKTHIYCIDDVVTTGASMEAISNMLEQKFDIQVLKFCICH